MNDELKALIDKHIEEGTFSATAAEGITTLRKELAEAKRMLENRNERIKELTEQAERANKKLGEAQEDLSAMNQISDQLQKKLDDQADDHLKAVRAEAKAEAIEWAMETVFKPSLVRKVAQGGYQTYTNYGPSGVPHDTVSVNPDTVHTFEDT